MAGLTKPSNKYIILSDSESSNDEYQYTTTRPITTNDVFMCLSKPIRKRARSLDEEDSVENDQENPAKNDRRHRSQNDHEDPLEMNSLSLDDTDLSSKESTDLNEVNNKISQIISSDLESSNDEYQCRTTRPITTNDVFMCLSKPIRKRARSLDEEDSVENDQEDLVEMNSWSLDDTDLSSKESSDLNEVNNKNSQSLKKTDQNSIIIIDDNNDQSRLNNEETANITNNPKRRSVQKLIDQYFTPIDNSFQQIISLTQNILNFRIRCKIICKTAIRCFGINNKVFDAIVCDKSAEIKVGVFNNEVDRFYDIMIINKSIIIENGKIQLANKNFRSPYSTLEIQLLPNTNIQLYNCTNFKPMMRITKTELRHISETLNGSYVDVEGVVIMDRGVFTTTSEYNGEIFRRRILKIKDETAVINITLWNKKINEVPERTINKKIRIRNGKVNHYNGNRLI